MDKNNLAILRQSFAQAVFNHQVQEAAVNLKKRKILEIKIINILLVSLVLVFIVIQALNMNKPIYSYISMGLTISEIIFLIIQLSFKFESQSTQHKNTALRFLDLRDRYKNMITDVMNESLSTKDIIIKRDALQYEYSVICESAPAIGEEEYKIAQKKLNKAKIIEGEAFTWSDEEIDRFLPKDLRLISNDDTSPT